MGVASPFGSEMATGVGNRSLVMAGLINGRALGDAVVVALPDDVGVQGECKQPLDRFSGKKLALQVSAGES